MKKKIGGIDGLQIGEILADFEQDHNEEKAVNSIFDAISQAKKEAYEKGYQDYSIKFEEWQGLMLALFEYFINASDKSMKRKFWYLRPSHIRLMKDWNETNKLYANYFKTKNPH